MGKFIDCPFCGRHRETSDEHVWAKWLHTTEGAKTLLKDTNGERINVKRKVLRKDQNGRYQYVAETPASIWKWLPNVKVQVCNPCNTGWMSRLENDAKAILARCILGEGTLQLTEDNLKTLSTWATKSWMAYALTPSAAANSPFTAADYRAMASSPSPFSNGRIFLMHSREDIAHVGMAIMPWVTSPADSVPDMEATQENTGYAYLAVSTVVLIMTFIPPEVPEEIADIMAGDLASSPLVQRAWPDPEPHDFPLEALPDGTLANFFNYARDLMKLWAVPVAGSTDDDLWRILDQGRGGDNAQGD